MKKKVCKIPKKKNKRILAGFDLKNIET